MIGLLALLLLAVLFVLEWFALRTDRKVLDELRALAADVQDLKDRRSLDRLRS